MLSHLSKARHSKAPIPIAVKEDKVTSSKMTLLDTFNSNRSKLKAHLAQIDLYIRFNLEKFKSKVNKVIQVVSFLKGLAFNQLEFFLNNYVNNLSDDNRELETLAIFRSYVEYKKRINCVFRDIDTIRSAERHIQALQQYKLVIAYTIEFQQYAKRIDQNNKALIVQFYIGLKD